MYPAYVIYDDRRKIPWTYKRNKEDDKRYMEKSSITSVTPDKCATKFFLTWQEHNRCQETIADYGIMFLCRRGKLCYIHALNLPYYSPDYNYWEGKIALLRIYFLQNLLTTHQRYIDRIRQLQENQAIVRLLSRKLISEIHRRGRVIKAPLGWKIHQKCPPLLLFR